MSRTRPFLSRAMIRRIVEAVVIDLEEEDPLTRVDPVHRRRLGLLAALADFGLIIAAVLAIASGVAGVIVAGDEAFTAIDEILSAAENANAVAAALVPGVPQVIGSISGAVQSGLVTSAGITAVSGLADQYANAPFLGRESMMAFSGPRASASASAVNIQYPSFISPASRQILGRRRRPAMVPDNWGDPIIPDLSSPVELRNRMRAWFRPGGTGWTFR